MKTINKILQSFVDLIKRLFIPGNHNRSILEEEALMSPGKVIAKNFFRNKLAIVGIIGFVSIFIFSFGLSLFVPLDLYYSSAFHANLPPNYAYLNAPSALEDEGVALIDSGVAFSIGLSDEGNVFVWGSNIYGVKDIPEEVANANIVFVSAGTKHLMAIDDQNNAYLWGYNHFSQSSIDERYVDDFLTDPIVYLEGGFDRTIAITESGAVYVWGVGATDILGNPMRRSPYIYLDGDSQPIKAVKAIANSTNLMVLLEDGTIRIEGTLDDVRVFAPAELKDGSIEIVQIALTLRNAFAVDSNGILYAWGSASDSMLDTYIPTEALTNIKDLQSGYQHVVVLTNDGNVYSWGDNSLGQIDIPEKLSNVDEIFVNSFQNYAISDGEITAWGNHGFILGTDEQGRNFVTQLIHGGKVTLTVGAVAVIISVVIGVTVGLTAGYFGGKVDNLLMRFAEIVSSFPFLPFAITLSALLIETATTEIQRMMMIMVILGVLSWPGLSRLIRGQILSERERDYVMAAKALGIKQKHIIWRHIFPAVTSIVIVNLTLGYAGSLLTEAGLSFLGFGVQKPNPSWGNILTAAQNTDVIRTYWWRWVLPGLCIIIAALSINLIGDALRDAMDPRNNER
ncbi:MAG: ABC transporter permease subunit [Firmicutes bacterium]|nr:ABC transporter permease subunit [Bacillota bacterium]